MDSEPHVNHLGQPVGAPVPGWSPRPRPPRTALAGRLCAVEPLDPERHAAQLFEANADDREGRLWTYYNFGPFATLGEYRDWLDGALADTNRLYHAICDRAADGRAVGVAVYSNCMPAMGTIEIGGLVFSPRLQRRPAATEAMYLMMRRVFDELGYRRCEWKCDSHNLPSRAAAARLGFQYEGLFRQAMITRGRNRDTAWFSVIDRQWPPLRVALEAWLDPVNFAADGSQKRPLASFRPAA
ncbi:MAG TPA: GNAT family protein [Stellaceae bacterium]|nr:GNAT family protein [Stellaceae bacterium]